MVPYNFTSSPSTPRLEALRLEGIVARRSLHGSTTSLQSCLKDPLVRTMVIFACVCGDWFWWKLLRIKDPLFKEFVFRGICCVSCLCFSPLHCLAGSVQQPRLWFYILPLSLCCHCVSFLAESEAHWTILILENKKTSVGISSKNTFSSETKTLAVSIPRAVGWASQKTFGWVFVRTEKRCHLEIETTEIVP